MSNVLRDLISPIAALVAILAMGMATPARADLEIQLSTDGVTYTTVATAASGTTAIYALPVIFGGTGPETFGGITFNTLSTSSNSPGTASLAKLLGATLDAVNNSGSTATVYIRLGDINFSSPTTPPSITVNSHIGGSVVVGNSLNALTFQSYVNQDNSQNGVTGTTPGPQTPNITGTSSGSFASDAFASITSLASPFSITEQLVLTLGDGAGEINFSSNTTLTPVPEPSTLAIAGLGALGMIGYGIRRRKGA